MDKDGFDEGVGTARDYTGYSGARKVAEEPSVDPGFMRGRDARLRAAQDQNQACVSETARCWTAHDQIRRRIHELRLEADRLEDLVNILPGVMPTSADYALQALLRKP